MSRLASPFQDRKIHLLGAETDQVVTVTVSYGSARAPVTSRPSQPTVDAVVPEYSAIEIVLLLALSSHRPSGSSRVG